MTVRINKAGTVVLILFILLFISFPVMAKPGETSRVNLSAQGTQTTGDNFSEPYWKYRPRISGDGKIIAFVSLADNFGITDENGVTDVYSYERETGKVKRVSMGTKTIYEGTVESNPFLSRIPNITEKVVPAEYSTPCDSPIINKDGKYITYSSSNTSLSDDGRYITIIINEIPGKDTRYSGDYLNVFILDRNTHQYEKVSVSSHGHNGNGDSYAGAISGDGRYVAFISRASNLVSESYVGPANIFVRDREKKDTVGICLFTRPSADGLGESIDISSDGRYIVFESDSKSVVPEDTNVASDIFVYDRESGETTRVSVASDGSEANGRSHCSAISADGRYVTFYSLASNLVEKDTNKCADVFVHDLQTGKTMRASVSSSGEQGNKESVAPSISDDGRLVAFLSAASNLVEKDTNQKMDVFVHEVEFPAELPPTPACLICLTIDKPTALVNGAEESLEIPPQLMEGSTYVPLRFIAEKFGAVVEWQTESQTVIIRKGDLERSLSTAESGNGVRALIIQGRTMVPLRYISESLGALVQWFPDDKRIEIRYQA